MMHGGDLFERPVPGILEQGPTAALELGALFGLGPAYLFHRSSALRAPDFGEVFGRSE